MPERHFKGVNFAGVWERLKVARFFCLAAIFGLGSICAFAQVGDGNRTGFPVFGTFHLSDLDSVILSNGNLHIEIPIASFPERHGQFSYKFVYDTPSYLLQFFRDPVNGLYWEADLASGW